MKFSGGIWEDKGPYRKMRVFDVASDSYVQIVEVKPNSTVGKHYHKKQTEVYSIRSGNAVLGIDDEEWDARSGDIFLCQPMSKHWVINNSEEPFHLLVFKYNWVEDDTVWLE
ncbi:MAG: cupin domain-containing protein [Halobacteriota archaeon]